MRAVILATVLAGIAPASPLAAGPLSDLIMAPGLLADAPEGVVLRYAHNRRLPGQVAGADPAGAGRGLALPRAVKDGEVILSAAPGADGPHLVLTLGEAGAQHEVAQFPAGGSNPMLLFFLENVVRIMVGQTGGSPYYIRNRIRDAVLASDTGDARDGLSVVILHPFEADPNRARMGDFAALTLTLGYDPARPGHLIELKADTGTGADRYSETLMLTKEE